MQKDMSCKYNTWRNYRKGTATTNTKQHQKMFLERFKMFQGKMPDMLKAATEDPLDFFKCNSRWPVCAFNYTKQYVIPEIFTFKVFESFNDLF